MLQLAARMLTRTDPAATRVINILWPTRAAKIFDSGAQKYLDPSPQQQHHAVPQREEDCNCHTDSYYHSGSILDKKNIEARFLAAKAAPISRNVRSSVRPFVHKCKVRLGKAR